MTTEELYEMLRRNKALSIEGETRCISPDSKFESVVYVRSVGKVEGKKENAVRHLVCLTSFRCKLLDTDNLTGGGKYFVDSLRYAGLIPNDDPASITLQVNQEKVKTKKEQRTEITIEQL